MCFAIDADEHLIKMPAPVRPVAPVCPPLPDLRGKQRAKAVPPVPYGLMANVYAPFEQNIFDLTQRQRIADIRHHREANDLWRTIEIPEGIVHRRRLGDLTFQLKPI